MNLYHKLAVLSLTACLTLTLTAYGGRTASGGGQSAPSEPLSSETEADNPTSAVSAENGNILIASFTADENRAADVVTFASGTTVDGVDKGWARAVADMIAVEAGGTLFSIQTSVEYPEDGGKLIDYAADEQDQNARPELTSHIESLEGYDIIFVGYPTWLAYHNLIQCTQA